MVDGQAGSLFDVAVSCYGQTGASGLLVEAMGGRIRM